MAVLRAAALLSAALVAFTVAFMPAAAAATADECSKVGTNCNVTDCCEDKNLTCYQKNAEWATCLPNCTEGKHESDPAAFRTPWSCRAGPFPHLREALDLAPAGSPAAAEPLPEDQVPVALRGCSQAGENCKATGCCVDPRMQCYEKNKKFSMCMTKCQVGKHDDDPEDWRTDWTCKVQERVCLDAFEQCGGEGHNGPTCCKEGCKCDDTEGWVHHCLPTVEGMAACGEDDGLGDGTSMVELVEDLPTMPAQQVQLVQQAKAWPRLTASGCRPSTMMLAAGFIATAIAFSAVLRRRRLSLANVLLAEAEDEAEDAAQQE